ncbi:MAG: glycosyltransferase family 2 protein [Deltaproteobacteria bacterium]|nr:glycosyltransferase family 2 protein [Deltaproteobacteria bacterium]
MYGNLKVAAVIPARETGTRLERVVANVDSAVDLVVVVEDGCASPEATATPFVRRVRHERNMGVGAAILTGYGEARAAGCDVAVVMASDGQMDPADTRALLAPIAAGTADYVKGDRLSHPACRTAMPAARRLGNCCLTFLTRVVTGLPVTDSQCGYTALRLDRLDRLPADWIYPRYGFPNDLLAAASGAGLRVSEAVVAPIYRDEPSGIRPAVAAFVYPLVLARGLVVRAVAWWRGRRRATLDPAHGVGTVRR